MEYIQDTDGAWLEPHRDIPEKLFSMVIYLSIGPDCVGLGHRHLRHGAALGRPIVGRIQFGGDLRARAGDLARLRSAPDHRRPSADGNQLRPSELARPRATGLSRPAHLDRLAEPPGLRSASRRRPTSRRAQRNGRSRRVDSSPLFANCIPNSPTPARERRKRALFTSGSAPLLPIFCRPMAPCRASSAGLARGSRRQVLSC